MSFSYPQFRKNIIEKNYYQIISANDVIEWQQLGSRWIRHELHAAILPERVLIADLLACTNAHYIAIDEAEFKQALGAKSLGDMENFGNN
jgi:hypothetical protein